MKNDVISWAALFALLSLYEFTPKDAGTFWFHPHVRSSEQVERGLFGVLVVEDPAQPAYSRDVVWVLDDWLLGQDGQIGRRSTRAASSSRPATGSTWI